MLSAPLVVSPVIVGSSGKNPISSPPALCLIPDGIRSGILFPCPPSFSDGFTGVSPVSEGV